MGAPSNPGIGGLGAKKKGGFFRGNKKGVFAEDRFSGPPGGVEHRLLGVGWGVREKSAPEQNPKNPGGGGGAPTDPDSSGHPSEWWGTGGEIPKKGRKPPVWPTPPFKKRFSRGPPYPLSGGFRPGECAFFVFSSAYSVNGIPQAGRMKKAFFPPPRGTFVSTTPAGLKSGSYFPNFSKIFLGTKKGKCWAYVDTWL